MQSQLELLRLHKSLVYLALSVALVHPQYDLSLLRVHCTHLFFSMPQKDRFYRIDKVFLKYFANCLLNLRGVFQSSLVYLFVVLSDEVGSGSQKALVQKVNEVVHLFHIVHDWCSS